MGISQRSLEELASELAGRIQEGGEKTTEPPSRAWEQRGEGGGMLLASLGAQQGSELQQHRELQLPGAGRQREGQEQPDPGGGRDGARVSPAGIRSEDI